MPSDKTDHRHLIAAARMLIKAKPNILYRCDDCPEEYNCHPANEMDIVGGTLICTDCNDHFAPAIVPPDPLDLIAKLVDALAAQPVASPGIERIAAERRRQIKAEGFGPEHDSGNLDGEMIRAALCYAMHADLGQEEYPRGLDLWPWAAAWWKPSDDPIRDLEKAGALIAAEIDRRLRANRSV